MAASSARTSSPSAQPAVGIPPLSLLAQLPILLWTTDRHLRLSRPASLPGTAQGSSTTFDVGTPVDELFDLPQDGFLACHHGALTGEQQSVRLTHGQRGFQAHLQPERDEAGAIVGVIGIAIPEGRHAPQDTHQLAIAGRLAGNIAHDFNNLLTIIVSYSQFLLDQLKHDANAYDDVKVVYDAARRGGELITTLLTFGQRARMRPSLIAVPDLLDELIDHSAIPATIVTHRSYPTTSLNVYADPHYLHEALSNLVRNAVEAMPEGGELSVTAHPVARPQPPCHAPNYVELRISDTGPGMDDATLAQAFEPFFSTKDRASGKNKGMGLPASYGIVRQCSGTIEVDSLVGHGTTFKIKLPSNKP